MDHIQDVYKKKPEMINAIWDYITKVNLKVDGKPFQVVYNDETDELEYRGRSGNETKVGPLIDDMYRLFSKPINDAIRHIEKRVDVFKRYKFLTFEVIDEILLLTAIIDKNGKFIDNPDDIDKIAKELDTDVMPCLWKGKLSNEQRDILMTAISTDIVPTKDEFVKWVKELFGTYAKFPKNLISRSNEFIEGIVFFYEVDGKVVEYKLVDPTFRQMVRDNHAGMKKDGEENAERYNEIYEIFLNWSEENATGLDDNRMRSIEFNFIEMMKDSKLYNKLMKLGTGLTTITTDAYFLQPDRISDELKKAIKKHGKVYQLLYEKFVRLFYKAKKRGFVVSKEFQQRVNVCTEKFADYSLNEDEIEINGETINESKSDYGTSYDFTINPTMLHNVLPESDFSNITTLDAYVGIFKEMICNRHSISAEKSEKIFDCEISTKQNTELYKLIKKCYDVWKETYNLNKNYVPFRFTEGRDIKIARCYGTIVDNWELKLSGRQISFDIVDKQGNKINKITIRYGNGLGGHTKSGMDFEYSIFIALKSWIINKFGKNTTDETLKTWAGGDSAVYEVLKSFDDDNVFVKHVKRILNGIDINEDNISNYVQNPSPSNRPFATDIASSENFETSGNKIADIVITNKPVFKSQKNNLGKFDVMKLDLNNSIFISIKKESHQWTGSTVSPDEYGSHWLREMINETSNDNARKSWNKFWEKIGFTKVSDKDSNDNKTANEILEALKNRVAESKTFDFSNDNITNNSILQMAKNLLGTNYWIIQEEKNDIFYLKHELTSETAKLEKIHISKAKSDSSLTMSIVSDKCTLKLRTTGTDLIVRMFPEFSDEQFNNLTK